MPVNGYPRVRFDVSPGSSQNGGCLVSKTPSVGLWWLPLCTLLPLDTVNFLLELRRSHAEVAGPVSGHSLPEAL